MSEELAKSPPTTMVQDVNGINSRPPRRNGGKRTPLSCLACRQHKLRCDRRVPCGTCIRYHREAQCRENPAPTRRRAAPGTVLDRQRTEEQLSYAEAAISNGWQDVHTRELRSHGTDAAHASFGVHTVSGPAGTAPELSSLGFASLARVVGLDVHMHGPPPPSLPQILAEANHQQQHPSSSWNFLEPDYRRLVWRRQLSSVVPSRSQCDLLVNYYLEHVNWIFQTIHAPSFRREYAVFWDTGMDQVDLIWLSLLLTMISISALYVPLQSIEVVGCPKDAIRPLAHVWHQSSQHALRAADYDARPCLTQLQTFSVTQLYWYATNNIERLNSHLGQAIRNAQAIGLDKDNAPSTCVQDEMRHRIWWDLVDADTFQTLCLERDPMIRLKNPGVPLPMNCNDDDLSEIFARARPLDSPTIMSMNIYRAKVSQILNMHFWVTNGECLQDIKSVHKLDKEILELMANLPWYFQLDEEGKPPRLPEPLHEVLTWQNHILRTYISTQRIRMYRIFLASRVEDSWENVIKAADDAMVVYRTLRTSQAPTSHQKFFTQAYQVFSVAVTVAALLLVEGTLPIPNVYQQIEDMAVDLRILENQGCPVPVATHGRQVLLKMLRLVDSRLTDPTSPEDARKLVPEISTILGGENRTRQYMNRLSSNARTNSPATGVSNDPQLLQHNTEEATMEIVEAENTVDATGLSSLMDSSWEGMMGEVDLELFLEDSRHLRLLDWDMTGLLADAQGK